jgi:hypothetical protein
MEHPPRVLLRQPVLKSRGDFLNVIRSLLVVGAQRPLEFAGAVGRFGSIFLLTYCSADGRLGGYGKMDAKRASTFGSMTYFRNRKAASLFPPFGTIHVS